MITDRELLRRAMNWISEGRSENADIKIGVLIEEAGKRFNLSPLQMDSLLRILKDDVGDE